MGALQQARNAIKKVSRDVDCGQYERFDDDLRKEFISITLDYLCKYVEILKKHYERSNRSELDSNNTWLAKFIGNAYHVLFPLQAKPKKDHRRD